MTLHTMPKALQPDQIGPQPEVKTSENVDGTTPINSQVARLREVVSKLTQKAELIEGFLNTPNVTDGPAMDEPFEEMAARAQIIRNALKNIDGLDVGDEDFGEKLDAIVKGVALDRN